MKPKTSKPERATQAELQEWFRETGEVEPTDPYEKLMLARKIATDLERIVHVNGIDIGPIIPETPKEFWEAILDIMLGPLGCFIIIVLIIMGGFLYEVIKAGF